MKRKLEHLHFEEAQTGEAMLSELESTDSPASTLAKLQALCCDNCALFMSELLTSNRARLLNNLRRVVAQESKDSSNSAPNTAVIVDVLSQFGDRVSTVGLPSAISLDLGDFVGYVAEATCKDNVERLNDVITFIASTLHAFESKKKTVCVFML